MRLTVLTNGGIWVLCLLALMLLLALARRRYNAIREQYEAGFDSADRSSPTAGQGYAFRQQAS